MLISLSRESLTEIATEYRRQQRAAHTADGACKAEGAALAIEHLVNVCFEPPLTVVIEEPEVKADEPSPAQPPPQ